MKIAIVGAGGAGGYFAARWAAAGLEVTVVARGQHLEAIRTSGIEVKSPLGNAIVRVRAVARPNDIGPVDLIIVATKAWQLPSAIESLRPVVDPSTAIFGIQNGVESAQLLARSLDTANVLGATCRIISYLSEPGVIRHIGADPTIIFGELSGELSTRAEQFALALNLGQTVLAIATNDIQGEIWRKFMFFSPVSGVGSVTRSPIGVFRAQPETRSLLQSAIREVYDVGLASGVDLPPSCVEDALRFIDTFPAAGTSSMQRDFEAGRRTELEALAGAVLRIGQRHGVETPVHEFIYAALVPLELRARGELDW